MVQHDLFFSAVGMVVDPAYEQQIAPAIAQVHAAGALGYDSEYASLHLLEDTQMQHQVALYVRAQQQRNPVYCVIIGIGGSNLGTKAVYEALYGAVHYATKPTIQPLFADTVDAHSLQNMLAAVSQTLADGREVVVNLISKSGTTTESIANFELFWELLVRYRGDRAHESVVVTTDKNSPLWHWAYKKNITRLEIPALVGGRYSVLSPVGLFPLGLLGVDVQNLVAGAAHMAQLCRQENLHLNPAVQRAIMIVDQYRKGMNIHDMFVGFPNLESFGKWYRQLMAESLGKEVDRSGTVVNVGITPTVSVCSVDLHSVAQLYLAGPRDKVTTFIDVADQDSTLCIPDLGKEFEDLVAKIQGKPVSFIMQAIMKGVQKAYAESNRPFMSIVLARLDAYALGQLLQLHMIEIMYAGYLLHINSFDQPQVELYKQATRKILADE